MRTTVNLDPALIERAKVIAARTGKSFSEVIEDAVRESMARRDRFKDRGATPFPVHHGGALRAGVDLDSSARLLEIMEAGRR